MSIVRTIGEGFAWNASAVAVLKIISFGNLFLILSQLTVYEYGLTELTMSIASVFGLFLLPGLTAIVTADLGVERARHNPGAMKSLFLEYITVSMALGVVAWAVLFFGSSLVAHWTGNELIDRFFKIVSFLFLTGPLRTASTMLATVMIRFRDLSLFSVAEESVKGLFLLLFFFVFDRGADGLLMAIVGAQVIVVIMFFPRTLSAFREFSHAPPEESRPLWHILREHRKWGVLATYIGTTGTSVRLFVIKFMLGTEAVGIYSFAVGFLNQLSGLLPLGPVVGPLIPKYIDRPADLLRLLRASLRLQIGVAIFLIVGSIIVVPFVVTTWFTHYTSSIPVFFLLIPALLPLGMMSLYSPIFLALKEQRSQTVSALFKFTVDVISLPLLILGLGLAGTGVHSVVVATATAAERYWRLSRLFPSLVLRLSDLWHVDPLEREALAVLWAQILRATTWTRRS